MEHFHNNLMKLGGSLGNVPQKMKNLVLKLDIFWTVSPFLRVLIVLSINCTLENGLTVRNTQSY
jgi:hypothetical protein